jgi:hypothetical protein
VDSAIAEIDSLNYGFRDYDRLMQSADVR